MKKLLAPLVLISTLLIQTSCSEKFNVTAPYKNITAIYGLLDVADSAQYIRVQKAFLDENKSAIDMSKVADSNFFRSIEVTMKEMTYKGVVLSTTTLDRVDLNLEGYVKDSGDFFTSPSYAYKYKKKLDPTKIYRLYVKNLETGNVDSATTPVINDITSDFRVNVIDDTETTYKFGFDVTYTAESQKVSITGRYTAPAGFEFNGYTTPVAVTSGVFRFKWVDSNTLTGEKENKYYDMSLGYLSLGNGPSFEYELKRYMFFSQLGAVMGEAKANHVRLIDKFELYMYLGTHDYNTYLQVASIQGVGLTGNEIQPFYTNLKGKDVYGLFTARGRKIGTQRFTDETVAAMRTNTYLQNCKIVGKAYDQ